MIKRDAQGRMYTVPDAAPIDLPKARRECHDHVAGNVPFHVDPFTPSPIDAPAEQVQFCECIPGLVLCDWCRDDG